LHIVGLAGDRIYFRIKQGFCKKPVSWSELMMAWVSNCLNKSMKPKISPMAVGHCIERLIYQMAPFDHN